MTERELIARPEDREEEVENEEEVRERKDGNMERVTMRFPAEMLDVVDERAESGWYKDRSEVIREALRSHLNE